jgi:hypothetical protein
MPDYRTMFDAKWVKAWDLGGKARVVTIEKVEAGFIEDKQKGKKDRLPIVWFKGAKKPLGFNKTNSKNVANMYGKNTEDWIGKSVTNYPTTCQVGADPNVDCILIKPEPPKGKAEDMPTPPAPPAAESGEAMS